MIRFQYAKSVSRIGRIRQHILHIVVSPGTFNDLRDGKTFCGRKVFGQVLEEYTEDELYKEVTLFVPVASKIQVRKIKRKDAIGSFFGQEENECEECAKEFKFDLKYNFGRSGANPNC